MDMQGVNAEEAYKELHETVYSWKERLSSPRKSIPIVSPVSNRQL